MVGGGGGGGEQKRSPTEESKHFNCKVKRQLKLVKHFFIEMFHFAEEYQSVQWKLSGN